MIKPDTMPAASRGLLGKLPTWLQASDIQGLAQLTTQGVLGAAGLAETVQGNVYKAVAAGFGPVGARFVDLTPGASGVRARGITGLVYGGVRGVTRLAGGAVNALLSRAASQTAGPATSPAREAMLSALNGVLGDQLLETANPMTITMRLRHEGRPLVLEKSALAHRLPHASGKVLVLIHGLCMNDLQWQGGPADAAGTPHDHGAFLARELGYTPVYLHYNTGLPIAENGQEFAELMEQLWRAWPVPIDTLTLLGHSMGGLVSRSACRHGEAAGHRWRQGLKQLVFLGTPHGGAPLEALGHWVEQVLGSNVVTRPFAAIGQLRSAGICDLREGKILRDDAETASAYPSPPLPTGVACFAVAATIASEPAAGQSSLTALFRNRYIGDGLVPVQSALGAQPDPQHRLNFAPSRQRVVWQTGHIAMLYSGAVAEQLRHWLADGCAAAPRKPAD